MDSKRTIEAVLFDLDGTLVETHIDFSAMTAAMHSLAAAARVPTEFYEGRDILSIVYTAAAWLDAKGEHDNEGALFQRFAFAKLEELEVRGCSQPEEMPGAASTLDELRARGVGVAIVTRNCRRVAEALVDQFGLHFDALLTRDDVPRAKPDPKHLLEALSILRVDPSRSMMVGDHWMDIRAGVAAGCASTVGILHKRSRDFYAPCPPRYYAASLPEILNWL